MRGYCYIWQYTEPIRNLSIFVYLRFPINPETTKRDSSGGVSDYNTSAIEQCFNLTFKQCSVICFIKHTGSAAGEKDSICRVQSFNKLCRVGNLVVARM